ncbi:Neuronal acetylcholine receptor subunit alpha-7 [Aix galericulata]|nr:Neuronal acetylcholine receptor subunit alpha-7 [Aix galericulata]
MKTLSSFSQKVITFLTIMSFLGEITGETFFHRQEHGNLALQCNQQAAKGKAEIAWYIADDDLQQFKFINCSSNETLSSCGKKGGPSGCNDTLQVTHIPPGVGLFACGAFPSDRTPATCPLFRNVSHCRHYNFFLSQRIYSTQAREPGTPRLTYNEHCCIDEDVHGRLLNTTDFNSTDKKSNVTILNVTSADSGEYLCIVAIWIDGKYVWRVANNLSVEVRKDKTTYMQWYIASGAIAGIIFLCVVTWLTYLKTAKSKDIMMLLECQKMNVHHMQQVVSVTCKEVSTFIAM